MNVSHGTFTPTQRRSHSSAESARGRALATHQARGPAPQQGGMAPWLYPLIRHGATEPYLELARPSRSVHSHGTLFTQLHGAVRYPVPALTCGPAIAPEGSTPVKGALAAKRSGELADCRFAAGRNVTWQGAGRYAAIALDRGAVEGGRRRVLRPGPPAPGSRLAPFHLRGFLHAYFASVSRGSVALRYSSG